MVDYITKEYSGWKVKGSLDDESGWGLIIGDSAEKDMMLTNFPFGRHFWEQDHGT